MLRSLTLIAALTAMPWAGLAQAQDASLTDARILHIAYTAGQIDVLAGEQALKKTKNRQVRAFAEIMVRDHRAVNQQILALVKALNMTPESNPTSVQFKAGADAKLASYAKLSGPAFDRAYIDNEVAYHKGALMALEGTLMPAAQDPQLKALLQSADSLFREHEQHAEEVADEVR
jgi:putative membrane protein